MIDVLLATYNGEKHLAELLVSLERQTHADWRLIVRDDGSADATLSVIEDWAKAHPGKLRLLQDGRMGLGPCANFAALLAASEAPYFMFCDQDDVWLPEKMTLLGNAVRDAEGRRGAHTPILAHSDLIVVDQDLHELHPSFWRQQRITGRSGNQVRQRLILQNPVTGCASIGNAALRRMALPVSTEAIMHDWWLALVAGYAGELVDVDIATVLYRQHGGNVLGAKERSLRATIARLLDAPAGAVERTQNIIHATQLQAAAFLSSFSQVLDTESQGHLASYARLREASFVNRKLYLTRYGLWPKNWIHGAAISLCM